MLLPGEVTATAWLPTCDVIFARQWSYPVSARQTLQQLYSVALISRLLLAAGWVLNLNSFVHCRPV